MPVDVKVTRKQFNDEVAPSLAGQVKAPPRIEGPSERFAWFGDDASLVVVAGATEIPDRGVDLALAYGTDLAAGRDLTLVLPAEGAASTLQRIAWLKPDSSVRVFTHDAAGVTRAKAPSRKQTVERVVRHLKPGTDINEEMRVAATPKYLAGASEPLQELLLWATRNPELDGGHRKGERNWLCRGLRVLSIRSASGELQIRAGVHAKETTGWTTLAKGSYLEPRKIRNLRSRAEQGIAARLEPGGKYNKPDEHWFQSVLRRDPGLLDLEHPVLREVPAWRPLGTYDKWSRSFIDLVGADGLGDIHVVETKLSSNVDDLFVWQGLDYFVWALAYKKWLTQRLATSRRVDTPTVQYVLGANADGKFHTSHRVPTHLRILDIPLRVRKVSDWYSGSPAAAAPDSRVCSIEELSA